MKVEIIEILMHSNDYTKEEAEETYAEIREQIDGCDLDDYEEVMDLLLEYGLDIDYLPEFVL